MEGIRVSKDATITIRVTHEEKMRIKEKAAKGGKSASEYTADAAMAGLERRRSRDKKRIVQMVKNQNMINEIFNLVKEKDDQEELLEKINKLVEGENRLWQCL